MSVEDIARRIRKNPEMLTTPAGLGLGVLAVQGLVHKPKLQHYLAGAGVGGAGGYVVGKGLGQSAPDERTTTEVEEARALRIADPTNISDAELEDWVKRNPGRSWSADKNVTDPAYLTSLKGSRSDDVALGRTFEIADAQDRYRMLFDYKNALHNMLGEVPRSDPQWQELHQRYIAAEEALAAGEPGINAWSHGMSMLYDWLPGTGGAAYRERGRAAREAAAAAAKRQEQARIDSAGR